jgi:hypothetical protein
MPTSDEDLQKKAEEIQKLRDQVANKEATREQREIDLANDITMKQLETEEAQLRARLNVANDAAKVSVVKDGAAAPLSAVEDNLKAAVAAQKATEKAPAESARAAESATATASGDTAATAGTSSEKGN